MSVDYFFPSNKIKRGFLIVVATILSLFSLSGLVSAYTTSYYLTKTSLNPVLQPSQVVQKGNATYVSEYGGAVVYKIINGQKFNVAGNRGHGGHSPDGVNAANSSTLTGPSSIAVADNGTVYIAEPNDHRVRVVYPNGTLGTVAGNGQTSTNRQDAVIATQTEFNRPAYVKISPNGKLYVADDGIIRIIENDGSTTHVVGKFGATELNDPYVEGGIATDHYFPSGSPNPFYMSSNFIAFDSTGRLYVTSYTDIYKVDSDQTIHKFFTPDANSTFTFDPVPANNKNLNGGSLQGFDISPSDVLWLTVTNPNSTYDNNGVFQYTSSAVYYLENGFVYTAAGGGNSIINGTTSGYGNSMAFGRLVGASVGSDGAVYFINTDQIFNPNPTPTGNYVGRVYPSNDISPPSISYDVTPSQVNDWSNSVTTLDWQVSDSDSNITYLSGCDDVNVSSDQITQYHCIAGSGGGITDRYFTMQYDSTQPNVGSSSWSLNPKPVNQSSDLTVSVNDNLSGIWRGEYFIGSDPGQGNATSMQVRNIQNNGLSAELFAAFDNSYSSGTYTVNVRTQDYAGNWSSLQQTQLVVSNAPQTFSLSPEADNYVQSGNNNRNNGADTEMVLQSSGSNRALVRFDQSQIASTVGSGAVTSAKLKLTITDNGNNWGTTGRTIDLHRLTMDWAEGNGTASDRGTGNGSTWACATDSNIQNTSKNCSGTMEWEMGQPNNPSVHPWAQTPTATTNITNNQSGVVELDVTSDIQAFLNGSNSNFGWILKKTNEGQNGRVNFGTKESAFGAVLEITYQP